MNVPETYLLVTKKTANLFESIQKAGVPDKFTQEFLTTLGFKSTSDRPIIPVLKALDFLDQNGKPTQNYLDYRNPSNSKKVLGKLVKKAYAGIFLADQKANELSQEKLKGIFASVTGKGEAVVEKMAATFKALCALSDFSESTSFIEQATEVKEEQTKQTTKTSTRAEFHYNIQIHLPVTKDVSVYNAIFKSLRENLMD